MLTNLYEALSELNIPSAYAFFREPQEPPYIIFQVSYSSNFDADDRVYAKRDRYSVILHKQERTGNRGSCRGRT